MIIVLVIILLLIAWTAFCGFHWSRGPLSHLHDLKTARRPGNNRIYALSNQNAVPDSPLKGKRILFLGSSVTYGSASMRVSFADYICVRNGAEMIKEAVPGTTLADNGSSSYIARLKRIKPNMKVDLLVCQLSTNDAWTSSSLGELSGRKEPDEYDTSSLAGAIEFIIVYTQKTWGCPVVFYTSPRFISERYGQMVNLLNRACDLWQISLIDMWNDEKFCALSEDQQKLYKADDIHPTQAGYLEWWTPYMEPVLCNVLEKKQEY